MLKIIKKITTLLGCSILGTILICNIGHTQSNYGFGQPGAATGVLVIGHEKDQDDTLIHTIQVAVNRVLGMLSLVAVILCLYAGFKMMTSGGDSKQYNEGFSILKNAAIGLAIIGLSWLIVSIIFWFINGAADTTLNGG